MSLMKVATVVLPRVENLQKEQVIEILCLHQTGLAEIVLNEIGSIQDESIPLLEILRVQVELDIPDLISLLHDQGKKPLNFGQLLSLALIEDYKSFYSVSALGSANDRGLRNGETLISVPSLSLYRTLASAREYEARISQNDPKRDEMIQNVRRLRTIGCEFQNRCNTKNMLIAVVG